MSSGSRNRRHGADAERRTVAWFRERGYNVIRAARGDVCDLIVWNQNVCWLVEVKATARKPTPSTYRLFREVCRPGPDGGKLLVWWQPHARQPVTWEVDGD